MSYRIKDVVSTEMLIAAGFKFESGIGGLLHAWRKNAIDEVYFVKTWFSDSLDERCPKAGLLVWNSPDIEVDIKPYIQDLIDLGYVEELKVNIYVDALKELKDVVVDLHDMADDYVPNYNIDLIKNALEMATKEHELLELYREMDTYQNERSVLHISYNDFENHKLTIKIRLLRKKIRELEVKH